MKKSLHLVCSISNVSGRPVFLAGGAQGAN